MTWAWVGWDTFNPPQKTLAWRQQEHVLSERYAIITHWHSYTSVQYKRKLKNISGFDCQVEEEESRPKSWVQVSLHTNPLLCFWHACCVFLCMLPQPQTLWLPERTNAKAEWAPSLSLKCYLTADCADMLMLMSMHLGIWEVNLGNEWLVFSWVALFWFRGKLC